MVILPEHGDELCQILCQLNQTESHQVIIVPRTVSSLRIIADKTAESSILKVQIVLFIPVTHSWNLKACLPAQAEIIEMEGGYKLYLPVK